jgi:periplasmic protein TonB
MPPPMPTPIDVPQPVIAPPPTMFAPIAPLAPPAPKPVRVARQAERVATPPVATAPVDAGPSDYLYAPAPSYPYLARQEHQQGTVVLLISIDDAGVPVSVTIDQSSGYAILDKVAQKAAQDYRFRVGDNRQFRVPITFEEN